VEDADDDAPLATIRVCHGDGLWVSIPDARIVGIRDGQIGISTEQAGPKTTDGDLWTQSVVETTVWLDLADIVRLDVGAELDADRDGDPVRGPLLSPADKDAVEARLRPFVRHAVSGLLRPEELDGPEPLRLWWSSDVEAGDVLRVSTSAEGEGFECWLWHPSISEEEGLDSFCDQLEDFISESRFAWGEQRLLVDRPWHPPGQRTRSADEPG